MLFVCFVFTVMRKVTETQGLHSHGSKVLTPTLFTADNANEWMGKAEPTGTQLSADGKEQA